MLEIAPHSLHSTDSTDCDLTWVNPERILGYTREECIVAHECRAHERMIHAMRRRQGCLEGFLNHSCSMRSLTGCKNISVLVEVSRVWVADTVSTATYLSTVGLLKYLWHELVSSHSVARWARLEAATR